METVKQFKSINKMKRLALILIPVIGMSLFGCENYKQQADQLAKEKDSLIAVNNAGIQTIDEFISTMNQVEENLNKVTQKENAIAVTAERNPEMARSTRDKVNAEIEEINRMMAENKAHVEELTKKLKRANGKVGKFEKMVASLKEQLTQKEVELA